MRDYWIENIHRTENARVKSDTLEFIEYDIDNEFVDVINKKYSVYNSAYNKLVRVWEI